MFAASSRDTQFSADLDHRRNSMTRNSTAPPRKNCLPDTHQTHIYSSQLTVDIRRFTSTIQLEAETGMSEMPRVRLAPETASKSRPRDLKACLHIFYRDINIPHERRIVPLESHRTLEQQQPPRQPPANEHRDDCGPTGRRSGSADD